MRCGESVLSRALVRWQAPVVFLFLSCDRSQRHGCMGSSEQIVQGTVPVKAAPRMQSEREGEPRNAWQGMHSGLFRPGVFASGRQQKDSTVATASQLEPCMAQERTLQLAQKPSTLRPLASAHCQHALPQGKPHCRILQFAKAWHSYPRLLHLARVL